MRSRAFLLTLAAAAAVAWHSTSAQVGVTVTPAQRDAITDTVRKVTTDFLAAMQTVDVEKVAAFVTSSPDYAVVSEDGSIVRTSQLWQQRTKEVWSDLQSMQIRLLDSRIAVPASTVAIETMSLDADIRLKSGEPVTIDKVGLTIVWVREASGWKILSLHQSFLAPKPQ